MYSSIFNVRGRRYSGWREYSSWSRQWWVRIFTIQKSTPRMWKVGIGGQYFLPGRQTDLLLPRLPDSWNPPDDWYRPPLWHYATMALSLLGVPKKGRSNDAEAIFLIRAQDVYRELCFPHWPGSITCERLEDSSLVYEAGIYCYHLPWVLATMAVHQASQCVVWLDRSIGKPREGVCLFQVNRILCLIGLEWNWVRGTASNEATMSFWFWFNINLFRYVFFKNAPSFAPSLLQISKLLRFFAAVI